jgi:hypothetical protein
MALVGRLSNHDLTDLFQRLTARAATPRRVAWHRTGDASSVPSATQSWRFSSKLAASCECATFTRPSRSFFGEPLSRASVKDYLRKGCRRKAPLFEYRGKEGYQLTALEQDPRRRPTWSAAQALPEAAD